MSSSSNPIPEPTSSSQPVPTLLEQMGGIRGIVDGALPVLVFTVVYVLSQQQLQPAIIAAVLVSGVLAFVNIVQKAPLSYVVSGLIGIGLSAFIASRTGKAEDFFLPGIVINAAFALVCFGSVIRKQPIIGYIVKSIGFVQEDWKTNTRKRVAAQRATMIWGVMYTIRFSVQVGLYLAGAVVLLGTAKIVMGIPLTAIAIWLTWLLFREAPTESSSH